MARSRAGFWDKNLKGVDFEGNLESLCSIHLFPPCAKFTKKIILLHSEFLAALQAAGH